MTIAVDRRGKSKIRLVIEKVQINDGVALTFSEIECGDVFSVNANPPFSTLQHSIENAVSKCNGCLLRFKDYTVAITRLRCGTLGVFDPHARNNSGFVDGTGVAQVIAFPSIQSTVEFIRTFIRCNGDMKNQLQKPEDTHLAERSFELLPVCMFSKDGSCTEKGTVKGLNMQITPEDLHTLDDQRWLNDQIINFYMILINRRSEKHAELPKVHAFKTFLHTKLSSRGAQSVAKWTAKVIFGYDILFFPIHLQIHWALGVVDLKTSTIMYLDSLKGGSGRFF